MVTGFEAGPTGDTADLPAVTSTGPHAPAL